MHNSMAPYPITSRVTSRGFTIIEVMVVVLILSVLAMLASTAFGRYRARSQQAEVATNLRGAFVAELAYFAEYKKFGSFSQIGFKIEGASNRYTYRSEETDSFGVGTGLIDTIPAVIGSITPDNTLVPTSSSSSSFTVTGTGNIDADATIDQWHVSEIPPNTGASDINDSTQ